MDNFTPLKTEKPKKKFANFFLVVNILLMFVVVGITGYYLRNKLITTKEKAYVPTSERPCSEYHATGGCDEAHKECAVKYPRCEWINTGSTTVWSDGVGSTEIKCPGQCVGEGGGGGFEIPKCPNGQDPICETPAITECVRIMNCQIPSKILVQNGFCGTDPLKITCQTNCTCETPGDTPTPTPTEPTATNTPTPTSTPTSTPSSTPTSTPTSTPSSTPTGTIIPSNTPTATPTGTPGSTLTPIPVLCGTKDCDDKTNPCRDKYICVQAHDGSNYCTSADFADACKANPSYNTCCIAPGDPTATPTEIVLAQTSITTTTAPSVPVSADDRSFLMYLIPLVIIAFSLLL